MPVLIREQDLERVVAAKPENTSLARRYFNQVALKNSTHIAASELKREYGNIPVVVRGGTGVTLKRGVDVTDVVPMPIEIDDTMTATKLDDFERASSLGKNQIIDEILSEHVDVVKETINALCCQAHSGDIDYMMKSGGSLVRYQVSYGHIKKIAFAKPLSKVSLGDLRQYCQSLTSEIRKNGVGGKIEFIFAENVYARAIDLLTASKNDEKIKDEYLLIGTLQCYEDNDSYIDVDSNGKKTTKTLCKIGEIIARAVGGGQKLVYCKLDDVVMNQAARLYSFTVNRTDQRGVDVFTKTKPFPLINTKAIAHGVFAQEMLKLTYSVSGSNGTVTAEDKDGKTVASDTAIAAGEVITFTTAPSVGYEVDSWGAANGADVIKSDTNKYLLTVDSAKTVTVSFKSTT